MSLPPQAESEATAWGHGSQPVFSVGTLFLSPGSKALLHTHLGQGLDGCRGGPRRGTTWSQDLMGCLSAGPYPLEVSGFVRPGLGLFHKGEMNPESQSRWRNAGLKANGLKRSQGIGVSGLRGESRELTPLGQDSFIGSALQPPPWGAWVQ